MKPRHVLVYAGVLSILAGCASTANQGHTQGGRVSPIAAQANDFQVTVAQGAVAGALLGGAAAALLSGGNTEEMLKGALIGGAAGAAGGYMIAGQKQAYASKEDALNAVTEDARQRNTKLSSILATTDQVIVKRRADLKRIQTTVTDNKQKLKEKQDLLADLEADKAAVEQAINSANDHNRQLDANIAEIKRQFPDDKSPALDEAGVTYRRNVNALNQKPNEIYRIIDETSRIKVES